MSLTLNLLQSQQYQSIQVFIPLQTLHLQDKIHTVQKGTATQKFSEIKFQTMPVVAIVCDL